MNEKVGFIGLGIMGGAMAANLLKAGFDVTVWNRTPSRITPLARAGAAVGDHPADVAGRSDIIVVCVSDTPDVEAVVLGPDGVLAGARPGALVIDCSTISPEATRAIALLKERRSALISAAVTGKIDVRYEAAQPIVPPCL